MKPKLFIGSSVEGLSIAYAIQQNLQHQAEITVWDQGVFELSKTTIESLINILENVDFGIFVFSPDDEAIMRGDRNKVVRDNVIFELGLFTGKLSRDRAFFLIPEKSEFHLPTDLLGITPGKYEVDRSDGSFQAATGPFCQKVREVIKKLGKLTLETTIASENVEKESIDDSVINKDDDWIYDFFVKHDYIEGIRKIEMQIKAEKKEEEIIYFKSWISYGEFKIDVNTGKESFNKLKEEYSKSAIPSIRFINTLLWDDYINEAFLEIENALSNFPNNLDLKILKSSCFIKSGNKDKALEYSKCLFEKSDEPSIALNLFDQLLEVDEEEAHKVIHKAFLCNPNNSTILFKYFKLADKKQMNEIALFLISKLINLDPKNHTYWIYQGNTCLILGLNDQSLSSYMKGKDLMPYEEEWIYSNLGNINRNRGFYSLAIDYFNQALEINNESEYSHNGLCEAIKLRNNEKKVMSDVIEKGKNLIFNYRFKEKIEIDPNF